MKRMDQGKVSLVDFFRSIKFTPQNGASNPGSADELPFAQLKQSVRARSRFSTEESQLIRSAN